MVTRFRNAFMPNPTSEERRHASVSPFDANLKAYGYEGRLPSILFECRTEDLLLEDTVLMALRWQMAGGEAIVKLYSRVLERRTDFALSGDDECKGWFGNHRRVFEEQGWRVAVHARPQVS